MSSLLHIVGDRSRQAVYTADVSGRLLQRCLGVAGISLLVKYTRKSTNWWGSVKSKRHSSQTDFVNSKAAIDSPHVFYVGKHNAYQKHGLN